MPIASPIPDPADLPITARREEIMTAIQGESGADYGAEDWIWEDGAPTDAVETMDG